MIPDGPPGPDGGTGAAGRAWPARVDHRDAFGPGSPHGTLRVGDGDVGLSWQPDGWRVPVWRVPAGEVVGGASGALAAFEVWLETPVTGTVAVAVDPPGGGWAVGGGNVPDVRGQVALDGFVSALRAAGAVIAGEPRSRSSRPGGGGLSVGLPG